MSAHSTIRITRVRAQRYLLNEMLNADNQALESMMDAALYERLYNCQIVAEDAENDDWRLDL